MGSSVFALVVLAWSCLAASLGPLLVIRCTGPERHELRRRQSR